MSPTILLIDVASSKRANWKAFLESQNYEVFTARDANTALRQCHLLQPDLVLLHDTLPEMDSFELCRRLKQNPLNQLIPVVVIGSSSDRTDDSRGRDAGVAEIWETCDSLEEGLSRIQPMLRLKNCIEDQAKAVVVSLARSVEEKHSLDKGHSERLSECAVQFGESLGLGQQELQDLRTACLLHDIGKVAVPDSILLKPGLLDPEEMEIVKQHPVVGEKICAPLKSLRRILPAIRHHHERMDGSGYPDGLRGQQIPLHARILQIADIYDALGNERPYRIALSPGEALEILRQEALRGWIDFCLVREFLRVRQSDENSHGRRSMLASYYGVADAPANTRVS